MFTATLAVVCLGLMAPPAALDAGPQPAPLMRRVAGLVVDAGTRAPISGAHLTVGPLQVTTGADGRFSLVLPAGAATVVVTAPAYFAVATPIDATAHDLLDVEIALAASGGFAERVSVVGDGPPVSTVADAVAPVDVLRTPGALDNVFRTLQTLPGVTATDDFGSRLAVRGGTPDQNLTMMDGVEVHDPFRLFGLATAFNPETIERFELATGGFSAKYGDRLSSLLVVETRDGRPGRVGGSASLSATDANVVAEGGLPWLARGSWIATARRTYYDLVAERFVDQGLPGFGDAQARGSWLPSDRLHVTTFWLSSRQASDVTLNSQMVTGAFRDDTRNDLGWLRLAVTLGRGGYATTTAGWSRTRSRFGFGVQVDGGNLRSNAPTNDDPPLLNSDFEIALRMRDLSVRQEIGATAGAHVLEAGIDVHRLATSQRFKFEGDRNPIQGNGSSVQGGAGLPDLLSSSPRGERAAAWLQDVWQVRPAVTLQAGLRVDWSALTEQTLVSPRLSGTWAAPHDIRAFVSVGRYTQSPGYEKLSQADYALDLSHPEAGRLRSERAWLASAGLERPLGRGIVARAEGYVKRLDDLLMGRLETDAARLARLAPYDFPEALLADIPSQPLITTVPGNIGSGRAYGFDVHVSRTGQGRLTGWTSYTWGRATREAYGRRYPLDYDRRHAFTTVAGLRLSERWSVGVTARLASGFPRTAPLGLRVVGIEDTGDRDGDGVTTELVPRRDVNGLLVYAPDLGAVSNLNNARLPMFARLDTRITWRPRGATGRWEIYTEVLNALNRKNAGFLDPRLEYDPASDRPRIVEKPINAIPVLPTIGVRFRF